MMVSLKWKSILDLRLHKYKNDVFSAVFTLIYNMHETLTIIHDISQ